MESWDGMISEEALNSLLDITPSHCKASPPSTEAQTDAPTSASPGSSSSDWLGFAEFAEESGAPRQHPMDVLEFNDLLSGFGPSHSPGSADTIVTSMCAAAPGASTAAAPATSAYPFVMQPTAGPLLMSSRAPSHQMQAGPVPSLSAAHIAPAQGNYAVPVPLPAITPLLSTPGMLATSVPTQDEASARIFAAAAAAATAAAASIPMVRANPDHPHGFMQANKPAANMYPTKRLDKVPIQRLSSNHDKAMSGGFEGERKSSHNKIERRYRDKLNGHMVSLRDAIPATAKSSKVHKATVMRKAVEYIAYLQQSNTRLRERNDQLQAMLATYGLDAQAGVGGECEGDTAHGLPARAPNQPQKGAAETTNGRTTRTLGMALMIVCCIYNPLLPPSPLPERGSQRLLDHVADSGPERGLGHTATVLWWLLRALGLLLLSLHMLTTRSERPAGAQQLQQAAIHAGQSRKAQSLDKAAECKRQAELGLACLGVHVTSSSVSWLLAQVTWHAALQICYRMGLCRVWASPRGTDMADKPGGEVQASLCQALLAAHLAIDTITPGAKPARLQLLQACLLTLNTLDGSRGSCSPATALEGRSTALAALVVLEAPPFVLALYSSLAAKAYQACVLAGIDTPPEQDWLWDGNESYLQSGHWLPSFQVAVKAKLQYSTQPIALIGQITRVDLLVEAFWELCQGCQPITTVVDMLTRLQTQAMKARDQATTTWCLLGLAVCSLRLNDVQYTLSLLKILSKAALMRSNVPRALLLVLYATVYACTDAADKAVHLANQASTMLVDATQPLDQLEQAQKPTLRTVVLCLTAETLLSVRCQLALSPNGLSESMLANDLLAVTRLARLLPLAHTLLHRYQGCMRMWSGGHVLRTQHLLQKAAKVAHQNGQPRDEGLALQLLGQLPDCGSKTGTREHWLQSGQCLLIASHCYGDVGVGQRRTNHSSP